jgi:hypothetical protein
VEWRIQGRRGGVMNILYTVLIIAVIIVVYTIGYIIGFQTCRNKALEVLLDRLLETLEGEEDDK